MYLHSNVYPYLCFVCVCVQKSKETANNSPAPSSPPPAKRRRQNSSSTVATPVAVVVSENVDSGIAASQSPKFDIDYDTLHTTTSSSRRSAAVAQLLNRPMFAAPRQDPVEIDINDVSLAMRDKNINPSSLKFGFLGLGGMGSGIVKNLINSGHKVVVWNRTFTKCRKFELAGAEVAPTPSDVIDKVDITFSCVADPVAAKEVNARFGSVFYRLAITFKTKVRL